MLSFYGRYAGLVLFGFATFIIGFAFGRNGEVANLREETVRGAVTWLVFTGLIALIVGAIRSVRNSPQGSFGSWLWVLGGLTAFGYLMVMVALSLYTKPEVSTATQSGMLVSLALLLMFLAPAKFLKRQPGVIHDPQLE